MHEDHDHAINLVDDKHPPYGPIYSLCKNELSILWVYIDKNLTNKFIRPFKFPANTSILFVFKPNRRLQLYVNY